MNATDFHPAYSSSRARRTSDESERVTAARRTFFRNLEALMARHDVPPAFVERFWGERNLRRYLVHVCYRAADQIFEAGVGVNPDGKDYSAKMTINNVLNVRPSPLSRVALRAARSA